MTPHTERHGAFWSTQLYCEGWVKALDCHQKPGASFLLQQVWLGSLAQGPRPPRVFVSSPVKAAGLQPVTLTTHSNREMSLESLGEARSTMQRAVAGRGDRHPDGTCGTSCMDAPGARDERASAPQKEEGVEGLPEGTQLSCPGRFKRISKAEKRRKDAKKRGEQAEAWAAGRAGHVEQLLGRFVFFEMLK